MQSCTHDWLASCAGNRYRPLAGVQNFAVWPFLDLSAENCHRYDRLGSGSGCRARRHKVRDERLGLGLHRSAAAVHRLLHIGDCGLQRRRSATLVLRLEQVTPQRLRGGGQPQTREDCLGRVRGVGLAQGGVPPTTTSASAGC